LDFRDDQIHRYARHILLQEVGGVGQEKLLAAKVLVIGAGGLGSPAILYLAAAGVGTIGVVDDDAVDLSNLQRQVLHTTARIGAAKVDSAAQAVAAMNPDVTLVPHRTRLTAANAMELIAGYDVVVDGSDNFPTRFLVNDACFLARKILVSAAVLRFDGQLSTFKAHAGGPCYRCLYPEAPPEGLVPSCSEAGILGAVAGVMGTLQATEVLKELLGIGQGMSGRLLIYDALAAAVRTVKVNPDPDCPLHGPRATIRDLSAHSLAPSLAPGER
jgi:adenylyltransferase/sulfurtransferase